MALVAAAFFLRLTLGAAFGPLPPYITFYPATMLTALLFGLRPGLLATVLAALGTWCWILPPVGRLGFESFSDLVGLVLFTGMGVFMSAVAHLYQRSRKKTESLEVDLTVRQQLEASLRAANLRLAEADRAKNDFLATLSHELRNPLAPIRNSLYVLDRAAPGGEQARRAQAVIDRQVNQMTRLVDDLLDVTRISHGKTHLQRESLDLTDVVRHMVEDQRLLFATNKLDLQVALPDGQTLINGDRARVAQVIGNLLGNAAKFTPPGGSVAVTVEANAQLGQAVARVRDTGTGIAPEMLPRLFEPFTQADTSLDRSKGGLGLGLALVKGIMEMHGGTASVTSGGLGKGAEFMVRFPLEARVAPTTEPVRGARQEGSRRRVLVIEDNVDAARSLREVLELEDHTVEAAYSGTDAIETALAFRPEVVLCDIGLPGMDGYEVAKAMRADEALRSAFLVAVSGYALPEDLAKAKEAGFDRHLAKPPSLEKLTEVLASAPSTSSISRDNT